jgi:hypothetical protein
MPAGTDIEFMNRRLRLARPLGPTSIFANWGAREDREQVGPDGSGLCGLS